MKWAADRWRGARSTAAAREGGPAGDRAGGVGGRHDAGRADCRLGELRHAEERRTAACWRLSGAFPGGGAGAGGGGVREPLRAWGDLWGKNR